MINLFDRYHQGQYQEVYDELLSRQEINESEVYNEALLIMQDLMRRVRYNIEHIIAHLYDMRYQFGKGGFWANFADEEKHGKYAIFQPPTPETQRQVRLLEQLAGPLPLSLICWYEEVGSVNLIGLFPSQEREYGSILDPLYVDSIEAVLQIVTTLKQFDLWEDDPQVILAPDRYHKYGYSGAGAYTIQLPCSAIDAPLLGEPHHTTFVNYLRICMRWGGFPGLEQECRLSKDELTFLTSGLLPF
jgi:hypothetical protein